MCQTKVVRNGQKRVHWTVRWRQTAASVISVLNTGNCSNPRMLGGRVLTRLCANPIRTEHAQGCTAGVQHSQATGPSCHTCQACCWQPNVCPKHSHLQATAAFLWIWVLDCGLISVELVWLKIKLTNSKSKLLISVSQQGHEWKD